MSAFSFSERSIRKLSTVSLPVSKIVETALSISPVDFAVVEGRRSVPRHASLYRRGASKTMRSYHLIGYAVDVVNCPIDWSDWSQFELISLAMSDATDIYNLDCVYEGTLRYIWGGDWKMRDGVHHQWIYKDAHIRSRVC